MSKKNQRKLIDASKKMFENTKKLAETIGSKLDESVGSVYDSKLNKNFIHFEPRKSNDWLVIFPYELNIPSWVVKNIERPSYPFSAGENFNLSLYDPISKPITKVIYTFLENQQPFKLSLCLLNQDGLTVEEWGFDGCLITRAKWSDLDYSNDTPCTISLEITYTKINLDE
jgi:hypothetical protein